MEDAGGDEQKGELHAHLDLQASSLRRWDEQDRQLAGLAVCGSDADSVQAAAFQHMAFDEGIAFAAAVVVGRFLLAVRIEELDPRIEARRLADDLESDGLAGFALEVEVTTVSPYLLSDLMPGLQPLARTGRLTLGTSHEGQKQP
jgi:hypothetical protein